MPKRKTFEWENADEIMDTYCPMLHEKVTTYCAKDSPCFDSYTKPFVNEDGEVCCYQYDHDFGGWIEDVVICLIEANEYQDLLKRGIEPKFTM